MSSKEDEDRSRLERWKALRRGNRSVVTKFYREAFAIIDSAQSSQEKIARLNSIKVSLNEKLLYLRDLDSKVLDSCNVEEIENEVEDSSEWEAKIHEAVSRIEDFQRENRSSFSLPTTQNVMAGRSFEIPSPARVGSETQHEAVPLGGPTPASPSRNLNRSIASSSAHATVKLPKIILPKFRGDITQFNSFWESFECAVHSNPGLSSINKLNYLFSLLEGPAYRAVQGLALQEENYEHAIEILKSRFGKKHQIINAHMEKLLKLQHHPNEGLENLRKIYDNIAVHVRGLQSLGIPPESYGNLLIPIIMSRLPQEITMQIVRKRAEDC
eukprot:gene3257-1583_t